MARLRRRLRLARQLLLKIGPAAMVLAAASPAAAWLAPGHMTTGAFA